MTDVKGFQYQIEFFFFSIYNVLLFTIILKYFIIGLQLFHTVHNNLLIY